MRNQRALLILIWIVCILFSASVLAADNDQWFRVKTENFTLIGNAKEREIEEVGKKLEQFSEAINRIVPAFKVRSPISTTVIVFKDNQSFHEFKPKNKNGKITGWVAGYFQAGLDRNYIALSVGKNKRITFQTIFHEYTHYLIERNLGRSKIPAWFSEGLAEYYDQFSVKKDRIVKFGGRNNEHLSVLRANELIPLDRFFATDYTRLRAKSQSEANLFYAQSWALMQYLKQGKESDEISGKLDQVVRLLQQGKEIKNVFLQVFGLSFSEIETNLRMQIKNGRYASKKTRFKVVLTKSSSINSSKISNALSLAYLGDLHYQRLNFLGAESYLQKALSIEPNLSLANSTLGLVRMRQKRFDDASKYLDKSISGAGVDYLSFFRYAFFLSREVMNFDKYIASYSDERTNKMRSLLAESLRLKPNFAESHRLMGFINLVRRENFREGIEHLQKAVRISPKKQIYSITLAELYLRKKDLENAELVAKSILENPEDDLIRSRARNVLRHIGEMRNAAIESLRREFTKKSDFGTNVSSEIKNRRSLSEEELKRNRLQTENDVILEALQKPKNDEKRVIGVISDIVCEKGKILFDVEMGEQNGWFRVKSLKKLVLRTYTSKMRGGQIGCGYLNTNALAVFIYKPFIDEPDKVKGELVSIEFVPSNFILAEEK